MAEDLPQPNALSAGGPSGLTWTFWALVPVAGVGAGLAAGLLMQLLHFVQHAFWSYHAGMFLTAVEVSDWQRRILVLLLAGALAGVARWAMNHQPGGHGGELAEFIWFRSGRLPALKTVARAIVSIVIVGMGASLGREAAPKQTGAVIASVLSLWTRLSPMERRLLVACGSGAGIAAVYNVPLGGALFALEVLLGTLALPLIVPAFATAIIATWTSWLLLPDHPTYFVPAYPLNSATLVWTLIAGPIVGASAVLYVRLISFADAQKSQGWKMLAFPVAVFAALGALAIPYPQLLGNGMDVVQLACLDKLAVPLLAVLFVLKPMATSACLGSGAPGGLFTPTITAGALLGALLGHAWNALLPAVSPGLCALVAGGAFLAAATQGPVSAVVFILELTHISPAFVPPLVLAVAAAAFVARRFEPRSIYSGRIHTGRAAVRKEVDVSRTALDGLICRDYPRISSSALYGEMARKLLQLPEPAQPLYVIDETGQLVGTVCADQLASVCLSPVSFAISTADDLARKIEAVSSKLSRAEAIERLRNAGASELPVVETGSRRMLGVLRLPIGADPHSS